jgi:hypothetical protein
LFAVNPAEVHVALDVPVYVTAAERVTQVVVAQQRADGTARSVDVLILGNGDSELPQAGPEVETHVLVAQLPAGGSPQPRGAQISAHLLLHDVQRLGRIGDRERRHQHQQKKQHLSKTKHSTFAKEFPFFDFLLLLLQRS